MEPRGAEYFCAQVLQKDVSGRLQAGEELLLCLGTPGAIPDLEDDPSRLAKTVDALTRWVGSSNYRVSLLGLEILSAFVDRLSTRFKSYVTMVHLGAASFWLQAQELSISRRRVPVSY